MIYVLDTDHLSLLGHADSHEAPYIRRRIAQLPAADAVVTTVISFEEQMRGWMAALRQAKSFQSEVHVYARLLAHLDTFRRMTILPFDEDAATEAQKLRGQRLPIGTMDLKIAAIVLAKDALLVTRNRVDFAKVNGLRIEDWSQDL